MTLSTRRTGVRAAIPLLCAVVACMGVLQLNGTLATASLPGLPEPSAVVPWLLAVTRVVARCAQVATTGLLLLAVLIPDERGELSPWGYLARRWAARAGAVWATCASVTIPLFTADLLATPLGRLTAREVLHTATAVELGVQQLLVACAAFASAITAWAALRIRTVFAALVIALTAVLPQAASGHGSSAGNHQIAVSGAALHVGGVVVWCGGLFALCVLSRRLPTAVLSAASRRFSLVAGPAAASVLISGVVIALLRLPVSAIASSDYGRLVAVKLALAAGLLVCGAAHRRATLPSLNQGRRNAFTRLALGEAAIFGLAIGVATTLARTPPPSSGQEYGAVQSALGFPMPGPISVTALATAWYPELLFVALAIVSTWLYWRGTRRARARGITWPRSRTVLWCSGWTVVVVATSSGLARYAPVLTWAHMLQHLLLSLVAAPLLVLGAPMTLAHRALPATAEESSARRALLRATTSRPARIAAHPAFAATMFAVTPFVVYYTGVYQAALEYHTGHLLLTAHFLIAGYLFCSAIFGLDALPSRPSHAARIVIVLLVAVAHAVFGVVFTQDSGATIAPDWFALINPDWSPSRSADVRLAGSLAWVFGELPFLAMLVVTGNQWFHADQREQRRRDRAMSVPHSRESRAVSDYNAYLANLAARDDAADRATDRKRSTRA